RLEVLVEAGEDVALDVPDVEHRLLGRVRARRPLPGGGEGIDRRSLSHEREARVYSAMLDLRRASCHRLLLRGRADDPTPGGRFSPDVPGPGGPTDRLCEQRACRMRVTVPPGGARLVAAVAPPTPVCEHGGLQLSALVAGRRPPGA